jgi:hypothetical protein
LQTFPSTENIFLRWRRLPVGHRQGDARQRHIERRHPALDQRDDKELGVPYTDLPRNNYYDKTLTVTYTLAVSQNGQLVVTQTNSLADACLLRNHDRCFFNTSCRRAMASTSHTWS